MMLESRLASNWGWVVARGVAGIIFGILAFAWPGPTFVTLLLLFAAYAFVDGIANVIAAVKGGRAGEARWGTLLLEGLLSIAVAVLVVTSPARMSIALIWALGFWALLTGALRIGAAIRLRKVIEHEWMLALAGALAIGVGLVLLFRPVAGAMALIWWLAAYEIVSGVMLTVVGFRLRRLAHGDERGQLSTGGGLHQAG